MNQEQARNFVHQTLTQSFDKTRFRNFVLELLNKFDESKAFVSNKTYIKDAFKSQVERFERLGTYTSPDGEKLDVLIVHLTEQSKLERARTAIRNFVADHLKQRDGKDAALVAFVSPTEKQWRFSYVKMEYATVEKDSGKIGVETKLTPARRFSYIVGEGESCHTAQTRFIDLPRDTDQNPTLSQIEEAFSVEAVTKEFFKKYADLFGEIQKALDKLAKKDPAIAKEFDKKNVRTADFAKKLMGQIVFLYFIQKKGWLGVEKGKDWGTGPHDFLRRLADGKCGAYENFFNDILEPLFYDTLATDRGHEAWCKRFNCRIPFLNGGLFEPLSDYDWRKTDIVLPNRLFTNNEHFDDFSTGTGLLDMFDRYNFTVNEAEPLEKEVAIDPEMLGKVFENLIEENLRKGLGSYYTPREIVHYMCQESLINYLDTALNSSSETIGREKRKQAEFSDEKSEQTLLAAHARNEIAPRVDIETFVHLGDQISHYEAVETRYAIKMPKSIEKHARLIDEKLADITVCDPAVGSGAFPVGMMSEIVRARSALTPYFNDVHERTPYHFKRHAIQNCLYGVDIDPGAIEIAKLRLWLSLVVDEEDVKQIKPLPNLFYKVVTGNSLLDVEKNLFNQQLFRRLEELKPRYFDEPDKDKKDRYKQQIEDTIHELTNGKEAFDFEIYFSEVFHSKGGFDVVIANPPYVFGGNKGISQEEKDAYKRGYVSGSKKINLFALFVERGSQVLKQRGALIYILPNTLLRVTSYSNTRQFIIENLHVDKIVDLDVGIFDAVTASTIIISLLKETPNDATVATVQRGCEDAQPAKVRQAAWTKSGFIFDIFSRDGDRLLFDKLAHNSVPLGDVCSRIRFGVVISGNFDVVVSDTKHSQKWKPFLEGDEIGSFVTKYRGRFLRYEKQLLHRSRTPDIFETRKIMIQRITGGETPLKATLDEKGYYNKESILNLILNTPTISYEYLLGVLNSQLANWFYKRRFTNSSKLTVNLSKEYVGQIPIKMADKALQKPVERLVARILVARARNAEADVGVLKREVDQLVYALYGLTREEIKIVEGADENR
jgi:type I restriction-modification system DNA methylase subunit